MNIEGQVYVYGLVDSHGNQWVGAVDEPGDNIIVYGLYDVHGEYLHFDSDAHNLEAFAKKNGLKHGVRKQWVNVNVE